MTNIIAQGAGASPEPWVFGKIFDPTLKVSNNQPLVFVTFGDGIVLAAKPSDSRWALIFVTFGDENRQSFLKLSFISYSESLPHLIILYDFTSKLLISYGKIPLFTKLFNMQPKLFENHAETIAIEDVILYALGDFQSRGKILSDRELALDRLHGAFVRAFAKFDIPELSDDEIVEGLRNLGATVIEVPSFVAKRPYRVTLTDKLARKIFESFKKKAGLRASLQRTKVKITLDPSDEGRY